MSEPLIPGGCIFIARKVVESEIWKKPPLYLKVWVYLLTQAQHKQYKQLQRGQLRTSIPEIIEACSWYVGARKERPTKDQIFQILEWLRKPHGGGNEGNTRATMIATTKATQGMLVTIENYWFYQTLANYESNAETDDENPTEAQRKQRTPDNINKNGNNGQSNNNAHLEQEFEQFWAVYPNKKGKSRAFRCWKARLKDHSPETLLLCAKNYADECVRDKKAEKHIKHPSTFLSADKDYVDYLEPKVVHLDNEKRKRGNPKDETPVDWSYKPDLNQPLLLFGQVR